LLSLALKSAEEALDWAPRITAVGRRIARRCWPGPVSMIVPDDHPESLVHRLSEPARAALVGAGRLRLRIPGHPLLADCMRMLPGPVMLAEPDGTGGPPITVEDLLGRAASVLTLVVDDGRTRYAQPPSTIELTGDSFRIVRPGVVSEETLRRLSSLMVLFVCTGNTCRSPMAEALFRVMAAEQLGCRPDEIERHGVVVASAGIAAWGGGPASGSLLPPEWRTGPSAAIGPGRARRGARRGGCRGCLSAALAAPLLLLGAGSRGGGGRPPEGPPLLLVRLAYHAFSEEEIELAGGRGRGARGGGREGSARGAEGGGGDLESEPAAAPPGPSGAAPSSPSRAPVSQSSMTRRAA
jgi:tRNA A37 threonylcarbamoyladenosine synthetase subunit TsaC/SUA5/YrdC